MECENNFCIYQSNNSCILENISIDSLGICTECIYPDIDEKILSEAKLELLKMYGKTDGI